MNNEIPLPNGTKLVKTKRHPLETRDFWVLVDENGTEIGEFSIATHYSADKPARIPWVYNSQVYVRGHGLGRVAMKGLAKHYGTLRSSATGMTSDEAEKAWQAIGARRLKSRDRKHLDFSDYVIGGHQVESYARRLVSCLLA